MLIPLRHPQSLLLEFTFTRAYWWDRKHLPERSMIIQSALSRSSLSPFPSLPSLNLFFPSHHLSLSPLLFFFFLSSSFCFSTTQSRLLFPFLVILSFLSPFPSFSQLILSCHHLSLSPLLFLLSSFFCSNNAHSRVLSSFSIIICCLFLLPSFSQLVLFFLPTTLHSLPGSFSNHYPFVPVPLSLVYYHFFQSCSPPSTRYPSPSLYFLSSPLHLFPPLASFLLSYPFYHQHSPFPFISTHAASLCTYYPLVSTLLYFL